VIPELKIVLLRLPPIISDLNVDEGSFVFELWTEGPTHRCSTHGVIASHMEFQILDVVKDPP
jgi:hypothetical protein